MRILKFLIAIVIIVPVLAVAALYGISTTVNLADYRDNIQSFISNKSGFNVTFEGDMSLEILPHPKFEVATLRVDAFRGAKPLFLAENVQVETTLRDFFSMGVGLKKVALDNPKIYLYQNHKGEGNWEKVRSKRKSSGAVDLSFIKQLGQISIANASLSFENDMTGEQYVLNNANIAIEGSQMDNVKINVDAIFNEKPMNAESTIDLSNLNSSAFDFAFNVDENKIALNGVLANPLSSPVFNGDVTVEGETLFTAIYDILKFSPEQRTFNKPLNLTTKAALQSGSINLSNLNLYVGDDGKGLKTTGDVEFKTVGSKQNISADLSFEEPLDLNVLGLCVAEETSSKKSSDGWSEERIDLSTFYAYNTLVHLNLTKGLTCNEISLDTADITLKTEEGSLVLSPAILTKADGQLTVDAKLTGQRSYKGDVDLRFNALPLGQVLGGSLKKRITVPVTGEVKHTFAGSSVAQWVGSLNGNINLNSENITMAGLEGGSLVGITRYLLGQAKVRPAGTAKTGSFEVKATTENGLMRVETLVLNNPALSLEGNGKIDLNHKAMNLRITPKASKVLDLSVPVVVKGSFSSPIVMPDAGSVRNQATAVGAVIGGPVGAAVGAVIGSKLDGKKQEEETKEELDPSKQRLLKLLQGELGNLKPE